MPSPFPGMDPFLEGPEWESFHALFVTELWGFLTPRVRPRYTVRAERRVYLEHQPDGENERIRPDVAVLGTPGTELPAARGTATAPAGVSRAILTLPMPEEHRESYLVLRLQETHDIVAVIEVLSPTNKRPGSDGRREYLEKRESVLESDTHLVELDLLRGGARLPTVQPLPAADYYAFVDRGNRRPRAEVYYWTLCNPLPAVPVPLAGKDPDVLLELGTIFAAAYDRAGYDYSLDYRGPLKPPLGDADARWVQEVLSQAPGEIARPPPRSPSSHR